MLILSKKKTKKTQVVFKTKFKYKNSEAATLVIEKKFFINP